MVPFLEGSVMVGRRYLPSLSLARRGERSPATGKLLITTYNIVLSLYQLDDYFWKLTFFETLFALEVKSFVCCLLFVFVEAYDTKVLRG